MAKINENFEKLPGSYLFSEIARRTAAYQQANPDAQLIRLGIGDVTQPLVPAVIAAMHAAVDEQAKAETFHGYGPEQGYDFLREAVVQHDYAARGVDIAADEVFISDGAKSDCGNIGDLFALTDRVAVCDPVYPVYVDSNAMAGRAGSGMWMPRHGRASPTCPPPPRTASARRCRRSRPTSCTCAARTTLLAPC